MKNINFHIHFFSLNSSAKVGEGQAVISTRGDFPKQLTVEISVRDKVVGKLNVQVVYENLDLKQIIDDGKAGKEHGFKNFIFDGDSVTVQGAAVEWANCQKDAIKVVNYTLTSTDIGFCCTVWYAIRLDSLDALSERLATQRKMIEDAKKMASKSKSGRSKSPTSSHKASSSSKSPKSPHKEKKKS